MPSSPSVHPAPGTAGHIVVALLPDLQTARRALETLRSHGLKDEQIGLAMRQAETGTLSSTEEPGSSPAVQDAAKGAVGGGIIGGIAGLLTAAGVIAVPGLAPLLAGGALVSLIGATGASMIAGSGMGAVAGGLVGALISINVPETAARQYEAAVREGKILITVKTNGDAATIRELLADHGADTGGRP